MTTDELQKQRAEYQAKLQQVEQAIQNAMGLRFKLLGAIEQIDRQLAPAPETAVPPNRAARRRAKKGA